MGIRCAFGFHDWVESEHYPTGDQLPPGYILRWCKRCRRCEWSFKHTDTTLPLRDWVQGSPPRPQPLQVPQIRKLEVQIGLTADEQGRPLT